jgi:hypothetical protein
MSCSPQLVIRVMTPCDSSRKKLLRFRLDGPAITIGRSVANRLRLDAPTVSRVHASLEWQGRELWLSDLSSHNGTWLQTYGPARVRPCEPQRLLLGVDYFMVGPFMISVFPFHHHHATAPLVDHVYLTPEALAEDDEPAGPVGPAPSARGGARSGAGRKRSIALVR